MSADLHDLDFYTWTHQQADLIRQGRLNELDTLQLIEELDSMGARERRELGNRLAVLLAHLLKWQYQPERRGNSRRRTIMIQRMDVADLLSDSPGLKLEAPEIFAKAYQKARLLAVDETSLDESTFPAAPPFTLDEALGDFWP